MTIAPDQREVVAFLGSGAAFPGGGPVERVDTHGAHVFLSGDVALKLKRAVTYDYMDLGSPDQRRRMLERELELNAPAAPSIYRDVLPVTQGPAGPELGGAGAAVDWVLRMNRFPAKDELEAVAARGALDGRLAAQIGRMVRAYHAACPVRRADGGQLIRAILDELGRVFAEFPAAPGTEQVADWAAACRAALGRTTPLLTARGASGHVRRGHGDLHLRNIVLIGGRPVPFDALEFDETLGTCDVLYDFAFLLMDLGHRELHEAASSALAEYLLAARGSEDAGLPAMPLFLSVRAAIRAMVLLQTDRARDVPRASAAEIARYLGQAVAALRPAPAQLIAVGGVSGTGKTALARALAPGLGLPPGAVHLSTDAERKAAAGLAASQHLPDAAYAAAAREGVYDALFARTRVLLDSGYSVVLDGTFLNAAKRNEAARLGAAAGVPFAGLWLTAPMPVLEARIAARRGDASDADIAVLHRQLAGDHGAKGWEPVDASGSPDEVAKAARAALVRNFAREAPIRLP